MPSLDAAQVANYGVAFYTADKFAKAHGLDLWDVRDVMATMILTESNGYIYANDGQGFKEPSQGHTPWNWDTESGQPIGTPDSRERMRGILRKSLDEGWLIENNLHYDEVGSNGRSTGIAQQLSEDTGGAWGPMTGTMRVADAVTMFLSAVDWDDRSVKYKGKTMANWQTAMLLRVQQPLASEVAANYGASQLAAAQAIARDPRFAPGTITDPQPERDELEMATLQDVTNAVAAGQAGTYQKITPLYQVYRSTDASGEIILVSGDHSYWITDINVLYLFQTIGLAEANSRNWPQYVIDWVKIASDAKEPSQELLDAAEKFAKENPVPAEVK